MIEPPKRPTCQTALAPDELNETIRAARERLAGRVKSEPVRRNAAEPRIEIPAVEMPSPCDIFSLCWLEPIKKEKQRQWVLESTRKWRARKRVEVGGLN